MKIAVCCAMNNNRSMEAHKHLLESNIIVDSFGTSPQIKIPGESIETPNIYKFGTSYLEIYTDLINKNAKYYEKIGILNMLERNMKIKEKPENYFNEEKMYSDKIKRNGNSESVYLNEENLYSNKEQNDINSETLHYDSTNQISYKEQNNINNSSNKKISSYNKEKWYDLVITAEEKCFVSIYDYHKSINGDNKMYLVNFDIKDTINDASSGAKEIKEFVELCIYGEGCYEYRVGEALEKIHSKFGKNNLFSVLDCN